MKTGFKRTLMYGVALVVLASCSFGWTATYEGAEDRRAYRAAVRAPLRVEDISSIMGADYDAGS